MACTVWQYIHILIVTRPTTAACAITVLITINITSSNRSNNGSVTDVDSEGIVVIVTVRFVIT